MLAHTMDKLQNRNSRTPRKVKSNTSNIASLHTKPYLTSLEHRSDYHISSSATNFVNPPRKAIATPIRKQYTQGQTETRGGIHLVEDYQHQWNRQKPVTNNNLMKTKSQIINIPGLKQTSTQETWKTKLSGVINQERDAGVDKKAISNLQVHYSETERPFLSIKNDIEIDHYQRQISNLKQQLSESFSDKLSLELKLNRSIQLNKQLESQIFSLKKQLQLQQSSKDRSSHSTTLQTQNDTIIQLLNQYQETKKIIQKLIQDNENLSHQNEELIKQGLKGNKRSEQTGKIKLKIIKIQNEKFELINQVQTLMSDLDEERKHKYLYMKQAENNAKFYEEYEDSKIEIVKLKLEIQTLKKQIRQIQDVQVQKDQIETQTNIMRMKPEIQQYVIIVSSKDNQILQLNEELSYMSNKLKQVLGELMNFSYAFQVQKAELIKDFDSYKSSASQQISKLKHQLSQQQIRQPGSPGANIVYIQMPNLKQTKTRISGGYQEIILGQKAAIPVVASIRTVSEDKLLASSD